MLAVLAARWLVRGLTTRRLESSCQHLGVNSGIIRPQIPPRLPATHQKEGNLGGRKENELITAS
jgi:hypothetical protein